ncbi:MAG: phospholipid/cholesterol/gamma-HCH transport system substrate-binding protein [Thermoleophilaceae bacterium]|jgi:phospholipid/cholesterol/gamma-HCH transport system substrate-binding protein|nr:phospholipid/cholesterol/gamma-HCH transport system substrate-binding protein [Thermoleophilaceae bacterium]
MSLRIIRKHLRDFLSVGMLILISLGVAAYIISQQEARPNFPFIEKSPYEVKAEFSDAQAVIPGQGQSVRVAGVEVGKIGKVEPKNGVAVVTMLLDRKKIEDGELKVLTDATAQLRPRTGLKDMFIELDPGVSGQEVKEKGTIPVQNTEPDVDPDEFLASLDADTRSYLQLLINGVGKGFSHGGGNDLNAIFKDLQPTNRDLRRVSEAVAARKLELKRLIHNYGDLTNTLADRNNDVRRLVAASNTTLSAFAQENDNIAQAVARLPGALRQTESTLSKVDTFSSVLQPALNSLRPAFRQLDVANRQVLPFVRAAEPITRKQIRPFVRVARPYVQELRPAAHNLNKAAPDLTSALYELNRFFNMASYNPNGREALPGNLAGAKARDEGYLFWIGWLTQNTNSLFSTSDAQGPFRRALFGTGCDVIRAEVATQPALGPLLGLTDLLAPTGVCAGGSGSP